MPKAQPLVLLCLAVFLHIITVAAALLAPGFACAADPMEERAAVLLRERAWPALEAPLNEYPNSVKRHQEVQFEVIHREWKNPDEVRAEIQRLHADKGVTGVILVGAMPMHRFFMHEHANPNPLFYEDFDQQAKKTFDTKDYLAPPRQQGSRRNGPCSHPAPHN